MATTATPARCRRCITAHLGADRRCRAVGHAIAPLQSKKASTKKPASKPKASGKGKGPIGKKGGKPQKVAGKVALQQSRESV